MEAVYTFYQKDPKHILCQIMKKTVVDSTLQVQDDAYFLSYGQWNVFSSKIQKWVVRL
jgi:hypothetical protein